jgi:hypothetical protein
MIHLDEECLIAHFFFINIMFWISFYLQRILIEEHGVKQTVKSARDQQLKCVMFVQEEGLCHRLGFVSVVVSMILTQDRLFARICKEPLTETFALKILMLHFATCRFLLQA